MRELKQMYDCAFGKAAPLPLHAHETSCFGTYREEKRKAVGQENKERKRGENERRA